MFKPLKRINFIIVILMVIHSGVAADIFFSCSRKINVRGQTFTISSCVADQVISIRSADVGYDPRAELDANPPTCSWRSATCTRSVANNAAIMRCNEQRSCTFTGAIFIYPQGGVARLCDDHIHGNFVNIKYDCITAPKTTTTTTTVPLSVTSLLTDVTNSTITGSHLVEADADLITSISIPTPVVTVTDTGERTIPSNTGICLAPDAVVGIGVGCFVIGLLLSALFAVVYIHRPRCKKTKSRSDVMTSAESHQYYNVGDIRSVGDAVTSDNNYQSLQLHQDSAVVYNQLTPTAGV